MFAVGSSSSADHQKARRVAAGSEKGAGRSSLPSPTPCRYRRRDV